MPGRGRLEEVARGESDASSPISAALSGRAYNVYLNDHAYWSNIPAAVWEYTIGGYQVIKKWLSYRERPLLGRGLTLDEVEYVTQMSRRLAALVLLGPALDANYYTVAAGAWLWPAA